MGEVATVGDMILCTASLWSVDSMSRGISIAIGLIEP